MDDTQVIDCTQALPDDVWGDLESSKPKLVAVLEVGETTYDVYEGETKIGRDPATCNVIINKPVLSKEHAVLEVEGDSHMIADLGSRNKTRIGKLILKPHVRYALRGGEVLRFGDVCAKYFFKSTDEVESDTCSESMLDATEVVSPEVGSLQVPETPEDCKVKTAKDLKVMNNHVIPESPSASQSTPLPNRGHPGVDNKKPPDISAIKLPDMSAIEEDDDDSFYFVSTQPKKSPDIKASTNTNTNSNNSNKENVLRDENMDSDSSTDVEVETEKQQDNKSAKITYLNVDKFALSNAEGPVSKETLKEKEFFNENGGSDDKQMNNKVTFNSTKEEKNLWDGGFNSDASTDIEEDDNIISKSKKEKHLCNDEQENMSSTRNDQNINCGMISKALPGDIFNQPTQEFPLEVEEGAQIAATFGLLNKTTPNDASYTLGDKCDSTQDILEAFSFSSGKASPKERMKEVVKDIFDVPTQVFSASEDADQVTQPHQNDEKTFLTSGQAAEDDDYVPTQLFLDDSDSRVFKMPHSVSPAITSSSRRNQEIRNDKCQSSYKQVLTEFGEEIFDQPTQKYDDIGALAEEATQPFEDPCHREKTSYDEVPIDASGEKAKQYFEELCHTEQTSTDEAGVSDIHLSKPTITNYHEDSDTDVDDDLAPTQKFSPKAKIKPLDAEALPELRTNYCKEHLSAEDDDSDDLPPMQIFPVKPEVGQKESPRSKQKDFTPTKKLPSTPACRVAEEESGENDVDDCAPTQVFSAKCKTSSVEEKSVRDDQDDCALTQVFTAKGTTSIVEGKSVEDDQDDLAPIQVFSTKDTTSIVEKESGEHQDDLTPTQVFTCKPETKIMNEKLPEDVQDDFMAPTQVFSSRTPIKDELNKTDEYTEDSDTDIDDDSTPLQGLTKSYVVEQDEEGSSKQKWQLVITDEGESFCNPSEDSEGELAPTQELNPTNVKKSNISDIPLKNQEKDESIEEDLPPTQVFQRKDLKSTIEKSKCEYSKGGNICTVLDFKLLPAKICKNNSTSAAPEKPLISEIETAKDNMNHIETMDTKGMACEAPSGDGDDSDLVPTQVFTGSGKQRVKEEQESLVDCDATQELTLDTAISLDELLVQGRSAVEKQRESEAGIMKDKAQVHVDEDDNCSDISETLLQNEMNVDPSVTEMMTRNTAGEESVQEPGMSQLDTVILNPCEDEGKVIESAKHMSDPFGRSGPTNLPKPGFDIASIGFTPCGAKESEEVLERHLKKDSKDKKKGNSFSETADVPGTDQKHEKLMGNRKNSKFCIVTKGSSNNNNRGGMLNMTPVQTEDPGRREEEEEEEDSLDFSRNLRLICGIKMEDSESENEETEQSQILFELPQEVPPADGVHDYKEKNSKTPETCSVVGRKEKRDVSGICAQTCSEIESEKTGKGKDADSLSESSKHVQDSAKSYEHKKSDSENKMKKSSEESDPKKIRKLRKSDLKIKSRKLYESDSKIKDKKSDKSDSENANRKSCEKHDSYDKDRKSEEYNSENKSRKSHEESKNESRRSHKESDSANKSRKSPEKSDSKNKSRSQEVSDLKNKSRNKGSDSRNKSRSQEPDSKNMDGESNRVEPLTKHEKWSNNGDDVNKSSSHKAHRRKHDKKSKSWTDRSPEGGPKTSEIGMAEGFSGFQQSPDMKRRQILEKLQENVKAEEASIVAEQQPQHGKKDHTKIKVVPKMKEDGSASFSNSRKSRKKTQPSHNIDTSEIIESANESLIGRRTTRKSVSGDKVEDPESKKWRKKLENANRTSHVRGYKSHKKENDSSEEDNSERNIGTCLSPPRHHRSRRVKENLSVARNTGTDNETEICTTKGGSQRCSQETEIADLEIEPLNNAQQPVISRGQRKRNFRRFSSDESTETKTSTTKDSKINNGENTDTVEASRSRSRATGKHEADTNSGEINQNKITRGSKAEKRKSQGKSEKEKIVIKQKHTEEVQITTSQKSQKSSVAEVKRRRITRGGLHVIKEDSTQDTSQTESVEECSQPKKRGRRSGRSSTVDSSQGEVEDKEPREKAGKTPRMSIVYEPPCTPTSNRKRSSSQSSTGSDVITESRKKQRGEAESSASKTSRSSRSSHRSRKDSPLHNKEMVLWSPGQRQYHASTKPRVMFTGYTDQADEKIVVELGGTLVDAAQECTVLVTTNIRRTCKFLSIMGKGQPIVSPEWLAASKVAKNFVDPWKYLVKDTESEKKFSFKLEASLKQAKTRKVFDDISIHATPKVKPPPDQMKEIVECAGGEYLDNPPKMPCENLFVVSCADDKRVYTKMKQQGFQVVGTEFILTGLLQQKLLMTNYNL